MLEVKCENCGKGIVVDEECTREQMFCTLGCMSIYIKRNSRLGQKERK